MKMTKVETIFAELKRLDLLEDRREYAKDDLETSYPELNENEVDKLYEMIQNLFR